MNATRAFFIFLIKLLLHFKIINKFNNVIYSEGEFVIKLNVYETIFRLSFISKGKAIAGCPLKMCIYLYRNITREII